MSADMTKAMLLHNIRNADFVRQHRHGLPPLSPAVDDHPWHRIFFAAKLVDKYYQPTGGQHADTEAARIHAIFAAASHMDYGLSAIHLGRELE